MIAGIIVGVVVTLGALALIAGAVFYLALYSSGR